MARWIIMAAMLLCSMAQGQFSLNFGGGGDSGQESYFQVSAQASVNSYKPGEAFYLSLDCGISPTWHAYFRNPATVGEAMAAELSAPDGFKIEGPFWQPPHREEGMIGISYSYSGDAPIVVWKVTPEANAPSEATFTFTGSAQVCNDQGCAPPDAKTASLVLSLGDGSKNTAWNDKEKKVEKLGDTPIAASATQTTDTVKLAFQTPADIVDAYFFSNDNSISPAAGQKLEKTSDGYVLILPRNDNKDMMYPVQDAGSIGKELKKLQGILVFGDSFSSIDIDFNQPADAAAPAKAATPTSSGMPAGMLGLIGSLFLGGLILNLMPCVFPVIGLKIMSFVELGGGERSKVLLHSLVFVLGILISFWLIALALLVVWNLGALANTPWTQWLQTLWNDAGSDTRTWAVWMQNEWIVYAILLLLLALGLSMYGVFEIGTGATAAGQNLQNKKGLWGSFFQGLLVTVVATPCSAPILGTALPAAMSLPGTWMFVALTFMALGLAFPYIVLGAFPALVRWLPRPGAWMESLKQGLSFLLFAAAAWILDSYLAFVSKSASDVLIALVIFCAAFWAYGRWCPLYRSRASRITGGIAALALAALGIWGSMPEKSDEQAIPETSGYIVANPAKPVWNAWSKELMEKALADGHPVYVDFTAKWCATCRFNKETAYSDNVYIKFYQAGTVLMRADKTKPNAEIDAEMRRLGRSSVPVNALYLPGKEPAITQEIFTAGYLLDFLKEHLPSATEEPGGANAGSE